jgi:asparagine synthase (glutamine-hydrolysing)
MADLLPDHILSAPKQGFSSPDNSWFKGESIEFVRSKLNNKSSPIYNFIDFGFTQSLIQQHLNGTENRRLLIWSLLNLDQYLSEVL